MYRKLSLYNVVQCPYRAGELGDLRSFHRPKRQAPKIKKRHLDIHSDQISLPQCEPSDTIRMLAGVGTKQTTSKLVSTKRKKIDKILLLQVFWHQKIL